ncbi:MAG: RluA family pseudouridine synthase [Lachnospiraceae bacterium]|nr:RluA family pseudouridine synthase [Lachnospiraceae bacterium]
MNEELDRIIISKEEEDMRLDVFLSSLYPSFSRSFFKNRITGGDVTLNGKQAKAGAFLTSGDEVIIRFPEQKPLSVEPEPIELSIVYEDSDVIVVDKPKGMVVHPAPGHMSQTMVNALLYHCSDLSGINGVLRPGIVHRIDKDTTGLVIACKNDFSHRAIAEQLKEHSVTRFYRAIVTGNVKEDEGTIDTFYGRNPSDRKKMAVTKSGRRAVTHYRVLKRFGQYTYMEFRLETGRTHQIRVHMAYMNHPLVGDPLYGNGKNPFGAEGQILHAMVLGFVHPRTGQYMEFSSPLPAEFESILQKLENFS